MAETIRMTAIGAAFAEAFGEAIAATLGGEVPVAPCDTPSAAGRVVTVPVTGAADAGTIRLWIEQASADACARAILQTEDMPDAHAVADVLQQLVSRTIATLASQTAYVGITFGPPQTATGEPGRGAHAFYAAVPNAASCTYAVSVDAAAPAMAPLPPDRLDAVLGVDLPLVVRFGRTSLPFRAVAELGPGSVIDMGRAPEEPVDVLVGDRLIARGDVVVVGGNYGVRITEIVAAGSAAPPR